MKKNRLICLLFFFVVLVALPTMAIDRESLWAKLTYYPAAKETETIALQNLGLVEEILFLSDFQRFNDSARINAMQVLEIGVWRGQLTKEKYFEIMLRFARQIPSLVQPDYVEETKNMTWAKLASFGRSETVMSDFAEFPSLSSILFTSSQIKNNGLLNSLTQKISNAQKSLEKQSSDAKSSATNQIQAAINELDAQKGKGVTEEGYQILSRFCQTLIEKIQTGH